MRYPHSGAAGLRLEHTHHKAMSALLGFDSSSPFAERRQCFVFMWLSAQVFYLTSKRP